MNSSLSALYAHSRQVELARDTPRRCCGAVRHQGRGVPSHSALSARAADGLLRVSR
jgi:hypothetical protein